METSNTSSASSRHLSSATKRTRKRSSTSRNGCARCKHRRVKCDETRPSCANCIRIDLPCPGFQPQIRWSRKHEHRRATASDDHTSNKDLNEPRIQHNPITEHDGTEDGVLFGETVDSTGAFSDVPDFNTNTTVTRDFQSSFDILNVSGRASLHSTSLEETGWYSALPASPTSSILSTKTPQIAKSPVHLPTLLIEYWFSSVCPMRSTFDSDINYNRQLAWNTWSTSEAACYSMQTMAALCLMQVMPQLRSILPSLQAKAVTAVRKRLVEVRSSGLNPITSDLMFAVFALGTSLHWTGRRDGPSQSHVWCQIAIELLQRWKLSLFDGDTLVYAYFTQALHFWEMLLAVAGFGSHVSAVTRKQNHLSRTWQQGLRDGNENDIASREEYEMNKDNRSLWTRPNSWCGISSEVIRLFGQVLALCRSAVHDLGRINGTLGLFDTTIASDLHQELLALDFGSMIVTEEMQGHLVQTRDTNTPVADLAQTAEAYRQAALLNLYITFDDLAIPGGVGEFQGAEAAQPGRAYTILRLAIKLTSILEGIPICSGSRSIHAMLYLTAAAGLQYPRDLLPRHPLELDFDDLFGPLSDHPAQLAPIPCFQSIHGGRSQPFRKSDFTTAPTTHLDHASQILVPQLMIDTGNARQVVQYRLNTLQQMLPHGSSSDMLQLVNALWRRYDDPLAVRKIHWLDVLKDLGLEALSC